MPPMAAQVAALEPEMAPKKALAPTVMLARLAGVQPRRILTNFTSRAEMPPSAMTLPAKMKQGMASRLKLSTAVNILLMIMG